MPGARRPFRLGARAEPVIFAALAALHLVPIWAVEYFPTQDGPAHLENAMLLLRRAHVPILADYYELNTRILSNWLGHGALAALLAFLPPLLAEKVLFSGYVLGLPVAFRYALPERARRRGFGVAILPFVLGFGFHMGFTSFSWSLVFLFLALGRWDRARGRLRARRAAGFSALALLVALGHAVAFTVLAVVLGSVLVARLGAVMARSRTRARRAAAMHAHLRIAAATLVALAPGTAVLAAVAVAGTDGHGMRWLPFQERLRGLAVLRSLLTLDARDLWISTALAAVMALGVGAAVAARRRASSQGSGWLAAAGAAGLLAVVAPNELGAGWAITPRLQMFPFVLGAAWAGAQHAAPLASRALPVAAAVAAVLALGLHAPRYAVLDASLREYASVAGHVERGTTLLPLQLTAGRDRSGDEWLPIGFAPFLHAGGYVAAERDVVELANYEADTGHFPVRYRAGRNPFVVLGRAAGIGGEVAPPCLDLEAGAGAIRIDYVLVWKPPDVSVDDACVWRWANQLVRGYDLVHVSRPAGKAQLWRRRQQETTGLR